LSRSTTWKQGWLPQAIPYWQRAGESAARRSANVEAIAHFSSGLELLRALPATHERARQELGLLIALGPVLLGTRGFAAPETVSTYARARELCDELGETPQIFPALWGQWAFYQVQGKLLRAREIGEELLRLGQSSEDPALVLQAHDALWFARLFLGDLAAARAHCEDGLVLYDLDWHRSLAFISSMAGTTPTSAAGALERWRCGPWGSQSRHCSGSLRASS
jgi:predicted ATPase